MLRIVICDDNEKDIEYMKEIIMACGVNKGEVCFYTYHSGEDFLVQAKELEYCDLVILDMQMEGMDGHETAVAFRQLFPQTTLVFWSGVCRPTDETFKVTPFRYLYKNYSRKAMICEMQAVIEEARFKQNMPQIIGCYYNNMIRFYPDDILYIENERMGSSIHSCLEEKKSNRDNEEKPKTKMKLRELYEILKPYGFEYAHNSYIVNMNYVTKVYSKGDLQLKDGTILGISRSKQKSFREAFSEFMGYKY